MDNLSEEEKNNYIENINHYLDNLIDICYEKSNMQDMTATGIKTIKQPIFLIFDDLLNKIERLKNLNEHQSKEIEIKDKMIDLMSEQLAEFKIWDYKKDTDILKVKEEVKEQFRKKAEHE